MGLFRSRKGNYWIHPEDADESGLVGVGGDLEPATMLRAYSEGVFAWFNEGDPILWWSPDPRGIFEIDGLKVSRRLARTIASGRFHTTINHAFMSVIAGCADRPEGTWITESMMSAYAELHRLGHAHSVESWVGDELAGGIFGITIGGFFAGESMFTRITDGSKVALVALVEELRRCGFILFDTQFRTEHTTRMGATEIPRSDYLARLKQALLLRDVRFGA